MITVSDNAREKLLTLMKESGEHVNYVRVGVKSGGCSGLSYDLDLDSKILDTDKLFEHNEINYLWSKFLQSRNLSYFLHRLISN